jgi:opacity protein-like surface antigen
MKKIFLLLITTLLFTSSLFATQRTQTFIFLGAYSAKIMEEDATLYSIGYGWSRTFESDLYAGGVFAFNFGETERDRVTQEQASITSYDVDLRLGYSFESVSIFGIGAAVMQSLENVSGYGFGYGAGATWQINERWSLGTEYKIHSMTPENSLADYDYELFTTRIGYSW